MEVITKAIKKFDRELYCARDREGKPCVYRNSTRAESYVMDDGSTLTYMRPAPFLIFALTDNWKVTGHTVDWGVLPILQKLKEGDLWERDCASESIKSIEKAEESNARDRRNKIEDFFYDARSEFKKEFSDINVANKNKNKRRGKNGSS